MPSKVGSDLACVVRGLVERPGAVEVEEEQQGRTMILRLRVAPEELGRVIGRQGRTIRALRTLLETREARDGGMYELEVVEPDEE
jgi:hypothetical protein